MEGDEGGIGLKQRREKTPHAHRQRGLASHQSEPINSTRRLQMDWEIGWREAEDSDCIYFLKKA